MTRAPTCGHPTRDNIRESNGAISCYLFLVFVIKNEMPQNCVAVALSEIGSPEGNIRLQSFPLCLQRFSS